jgi:hypothetical protein
MPKAFDVNEKAILRALRHNTLPTDVLADELRQNRGTVYRSCKKLEDNYGFLASRTDFSLKRLFYFPKTQEVLTSENYDRIKDEIKESDDPDAHLYPFHPKVRIWRLSAKGLQFLSSLPGEPTLPPPIKKKKLTNGDVTTHPPLKKARKKGA